MFMYICYWPLYKYSHTQIHIYTVGFFLIFIKEREKMTDSKGGEEKTWRKKENRVTGPSTTGLTHWGLTPLLKMNRPQKNQQVQKKRTKKINKKERKRTHSTTLSPHPVCNGACLCNSVRGWRPSFWGVLL